MAEKNKIEIIVDAITTKAERALKNVSNSIDGISESADNASVSNVDFNASLGELAKKASIVAGAFLAVGKAAEKGYQFAREGAEIEAAREKFDRLADSIGTTGDVLLHDLHDATRGLYSDSELVSNALDFMALGLVKNHDEAVRLATVSGKLGLNMNQLVLTLTNKTTMRFDALGISVAGFDDRVKELEAAGMSADAAFNEAFLRQAEEQISKVGDAADRDIGAFQALEASIKNVSDSAEKDLTPTFAASARGWSIAINAASDYSDAMDMMTDSQKDVLKNEALMTYGSDSMANQLRILNARTREANATIDGWSAGVHAATQAEIENASSSEELVSKFGGILAITQEVGRAIDSYNSKQDDLRAKHDETQAEIDRLISLGWYPESQAILDLQSKLDGYTEAMNKNTAEFEMDTNRRILKRAEEILAADGLTTEEEKSLLERGLAMGVYTQDYVEQAQRVIDESQRIADAIAGIPDSKSITLSVQTITSTSGMEDMFSDKLLERRGYASGTDGWVQVPSGFNNDNYPIGLSSGEIFAVLPSGGVNAPAAPVSVGGLGGGQNITIVYSPALSLGNRDELISNLLPLIDEANRELAAGR